MTEIHHELTTADRASMTTLRARLAANPIAITRASFDRLVEQTPAAKGVDYSESRVGGRAFGSQQTCATLRPHRHARHEGRSAGEAREAFQRLGPASTRAASSAGR